MEDSSQKQHKPLIATFEPVSLGVNRPKRHPMKIRSNPLTDSGEIMVVSAGTSNESHVGDSDDIPVNGYMFSETSIVSNGYGLSSPDDIIVMNGAPLSGGSNFGNSVHRIVLNDDDYDDTVSPTGDLVDEIYENTAMSIPESAQVDNLARTSSDDNIYEEVGTNDPNSEEFPIDSSANEYCAPIPSKYAIHFPDFDQKPGKYRDPTTSHLFHQLLQTKIAKMLRRGLLKRKRQEKDQLHPSSHKVKQPTKVMKFMKTRHFLSKARLRLTNPDILRGRAVYRRTWCLP